MIRPTLELGDPALRQPAAPVDDPTSATTRALIEDLRDTLHDFRSRYGWGCALAAPVIGVPLRVVLIEHEDQAMVLVNPVFVQWSNDQADGYESCITFPALWGCVSRPRKVVVQALDETATARRWEADGDLGRILQHQIDHLDGLIWLDREPDVGTICTTGEYRRRHRASRQ